MGTTLADIAGQAQGDSLSGLDPETQAALRALNGQTGVPEAPVTMPAPQPTPASPQPPPAEGYAGMLMNWLRGMLPGAKDLAPQAQATPAPLTPEQQAAQLAERNRQISGQQ
jgi:hypothetical protein